MSRTNLRLLTCALALILSSSLAIAGPLASDGTSYLGIWHGSTPFTQGTLNGYVDWAVYAPGVVPAGFAGYVPSDPLNDLLYTYQVYVDPSAPLTSLTVFLQNPASDIGTFTATGVAGDSPTSMNLIPSTAATWDFAGIVSGGSSMGLVFASPKVPMLDAGLTIDHGQVAIVLPLPSPSPLNIPEPHTLTLAIAGLFTLSLAGLRRRAQRAKLLAS